MKPISIKTYFLKIKNKSRRFYTRYIYNTLSDPVNEASFHVIGNTNAAIRYKKLYLEEDKNIRVSKKLNLNSLMAHRLLNTSGMVVITEKRLLKKQVKDCLIVPNFIYLSLTLPKNFDGYYDQLSNSAQCDVRRIKKAGLTMSVSRDIDWVRPFVTNYHRPSMQKRHNDEAYIMTEDEILELLLQEGSEFINIYSGNICVASALTQIKANVYNLYRVGWLNGDTDIVHSGAIAAVYWYSIKRACELNCDEFNLGGTPAYIENGVFKYKSKWQAYFCKDKLYQINYLLLDPGNPDCYNFLKKISLIAIGSNNSLILLSSKHPEEIHMRGSILDGIHNWYVLRTKKAEQLSNGVDELPDTLKYWYEKVCS